VIVLPAYRAAKTLMEVVGDIPAGHADRILLVDDASADATVSVATALSLDVIRHKQNLGYGGNQKTCYRQALAMGADVVVMLHPDGQYDPAIIPNLGKVIEDGEADIVLGSRWLGLDPAKAGMPWWKMLGNRFLTAVENRVLGLHLSEYHTGYRAYSRRFLEAIPFLENSNDFVFDTQVLDPGRHVWLQDRRVPTIGKYHEDASSVNSRPRPSTGSDAGRADSVRHAPRRIQVQLAHTNLKCRQGDACGETRWLTTATSGSSARTPDVNNQGWRPDRNP
jgi:glycosyltransferase involved in cell wall biosynthesis